MDAVKFINEKERMCKTHEYCTNCGLDALKRKYDTSCTTVIFKHTDEAVEVVEKWSKEHLITTNAEKFKEVFGVYPMETTLRDANVCHENFVDTCFARSTQECIDLADCKNCKKWWDEEWKEVEK